MLNIYEYEEYVEKIPNFLCHLFLTDWSILYIYINNQCAWTSNSLNENAGIFSIHSPATARHFFFFLPPTYKANVFRVPPPPPPLTHQPPCLWSCALLFILKHIVHHHHHKFIFILRTNLYSTQYTVCVCARIYLFQCVHPE